MKTKVSSEYRWTQGRSELRTDVYDVKKAKLCIENVGTRCAPNMIFIDAQDIDDLIVLLQEWRNL